MIPDTKRTATVIARETTYVYSLKHHDFSKILDSYPTVKEKMELIAEERLAEHDADIDYLKDQITTTEVNIARVYN